jgi:hypothetical protein
MRRISIQFPIWGAIALTVSAQAVQLSVSTICSGAATLGSGSLVTVGQPLIGTSASPDNRIGLRLGFVATWFRGEDDAHMHIMPNVTLVNNQFQMSFVTDASKIYTVEASSNLTAWTPVWSIPGNGGILTFKDSETTNFTRRFYRFFSQ